MFGTVFFRLNSHYFTVSVAQAVLINIATQHCQSRIMKQDTPKNKHKIFSFETAEKRFRVFPASVQHPHLQPVRCFEPWSLLWKLTIKLSVKGKQIGKTTYKSRRMTRSYRVALDVHWLAARQKPERPLPFHVTALTQDGSRGDSSQLQASSLQTVKHLMVWVKIYLGWE